MSNLAIEIKNLTKTYTGGVQALKGIDLKIESGEFFGYLGANGAGKTTSIGIMTGLVNKTSGKVLINGYDIDTDLDQAKQQIGLVPQEFNFNIFENVIDILINQAGYYGIDNATAVERANEILDKLGLSDKRNTVSMALSGGMKRRLMIARALVHKPKILLLDEPTAGVDVELRHGMWEYLRELNEKEGVTIVLTTHYLEEIEQLCSRAAIIKKGVIARQDTVKNLLKSVNEEIYVVDVTEDSITKLKPGTKFDLVKIDENTIEAKLKKSETLNELISVIDKMGMQVTGIRPRGNRLEELFLDVIED